MDSMTDLIFTGWSQTLSSKVVVRKELVQEALATILIVKSIPIGIKLEPYQWLMQEKILAEVNSSSATVRSLI